MEYIQDYKITVRQLLTGNRPMVDSITDIAPTASGTWPFIKNIKIWDEFNLASLNQEHSAQPSKLL